MTEAIEREISIAGSEVEWVQNDLCIRVSMQELIEMAEHQFPGVPLSNLYVSGTRHEDTVGCRDESTLTLTER